MTWDIFVWIAGFASFFLILSGILIYVKNLNYLSQILAITGTLLIGIFIVGLWIEQNRPPLKTMGETKLWYSFFLSLVGLLAYRRWGYKWLLSYSSVVACVFLLINLLKPQEHSSFLMPALQSYWFIPHVTVYILSYAFLGAATIAAIVLLFKSFTCRPNNISERNYIKLWNSTDKLVYLGFCFFMLGMLMGCFWAKSAWGTYWSWDPKETWAFTTSVFYLVYIHLRFRFKNELNYQRISSIILIFSFILLLITWLFVSYLPSAQGSIHVY